MSRSTSHLRGPRAAALLLLAALAGSSACVSIPERPDFGDDVDAGSALGDRDGGSGPDADLPGQPDADPIDGGGAPALIVDLTTTCAATFDGQAIVSNNDKISLSFLSTDGTYTSHGSISLDFPSGFTGAVQSPEIVDGGPRHTLAITDTSYKIDGNHCWSSQTPPSGSATIDEFDLDAGILRVTFDDFPLAQCPYAEATCTISGTIETTGTGTFSVE